MAEERYKKADFEDLIEESILMTIFNISISLPLLTALSSDNLVNLAGLLRKGSFEPPMLLG